MSVKAHWMDKHCRQSFFVIKLEKKIVKRSNRTNFNNIFEMS